MNGFLDQLQVVGLKSVPHAALGLTHEVVGIGRDGGPVSFAVCHGEEDANMVMAALKLIRAAHLAGGEGGTVNENLIGMLENGTLFGHGEGGTRYYVVDGKVWGRRGDQADYLGDYFEFLENARRKAFPFRSVKGDES